MPQFEYKAITIEGETKKSVAEATDKFDLARKIKAHGETLVRAEEVGVGESASVFDRIKTISTVKLTEKITFTKNLAAMVDAGLPISRGIDVMHRQTKNHRFKAVLEEINSDIRKGTSLAKSFKKHPKIFDSLFVSMVKAGEESGKLGDALRTIAVQMERVHNLQRKVRGAMMYPAIIVFAMIVIGILMLIFVVPTLTDTFTELNVELPRSTQLIIGISNTLQNNTILSLVTLIGLVLLLVSGFRTEKGKRIFEFMLLHMPIIGGITKQVNSARTARTLSSLLTSGVEVVSALGITKDVLQNHYYKEVLKEAEEKIQKGDTISSIFEAHTFLYPTMFSEMVAVGEETGKLSELFLQVATFYEGEVEQKTKDMSTIIEPFLMIFIGSVVGFFAVSMITPIYSLSSGI